MFGVGSLSPLQRAGQVRRGYECRARRVDPAGQPRGDLLDEPRVAVRIDEGAERPVAGPLGVGAGLSRLDRERRAVPDRAGVDAAADKVGVGRFDVGDDELPDGRTRRGLRQSRAERDRASGPGRGELDDAQAVQRGVVGVEPPAQLLVELLGPVDAACLSARQVSGGANTHSTSHSALLMAPVLPSALTTNFHRAGWHAAVMAPTLHPVMAGRLREAWWLSRCARRPGHWTRLRRSPAVDPGG